MSWQLDGPPTASQDGPGIGVARAAESAVYDGDRPLSGDIYPLARLAGRLGNLCCDGGDPFLFAVQLTTVRHLPAGHVARV